MPTLSSWLSTPTFSRSSTMIRSAVRLPIPGTAWKRAASPPAIAPSSSRGEPPESTASGDLRTDRLDREQHQEQLALLLVSEAVQRQRVVAHDQMGVQRRLAPDRRNVAQGLGRHRGAVATPPHSTTT